MVEGEFTHNSGLDSEMGTSLGYSKETGMLRFTTDHFSEFYVATNAEVYIPEDNAAMTLKEFRTDVNDGNKYVNKTVNLLKDLDFSKDEEGWTPIGVYCYKYFSGTFDGQNHKIKLSNTDCPSDDMGLFDIIVGEYSQAAIKNLTVDVNFTTRAGRQSWVGGLCAGTCCNVLIENVTVDGYIQGGATAGGIIGWGANCFGYQDDRINETIIKNCVNNSTIKILANSKGWYLLGGIACQTGEGTTRFVDCINNGKLLTDFTADPNGYVYAGHLAGKGEYDTKYHIYINNFNIGPNAILKGYGTYQQTGEHGCYQGFEGFDQEINDYTYVGSPNFKKQVIGAYFGTCHFDNDPTEYTVEFPHGN